jgi:glutamate carboxypeptidase
VTRAPHGRRLAALAVAGAFVTAPLAAQASLSDAERRLAAQVDARQPAALALVERLVNINSGTMNFAGVQEVGRLLRAEFDALGFRTRWVDGAPFARAGHLVAERMGRAGSRKVLLIGHLDTVFEQDSPFQRFARLPGEKASGPGAIDMKGGDVVMLLALQALREAGLLDRLSFKIVLTGDEEDSGDPLDVARADLVAAGDWADVALGFEDGDGKIEHAVTARRGSSGWLLRVTGKPAHSSLIFREDHGYGAIYELARILDGFRSELAGEQYLTFNPGVILGGTTVEFDPVQLRGSAFGKTNVIAGDAVVSGDLRSISPEQLERTRRRMREIAAQNLTQTSAELTFQEGYPPMAPTEGNKRLLALADQASRNLGLGPVEATDPNQAGAADISFVASRVDMALDGLGMKGTGGHTVEETADLDTLAIQAKRAAVLLHRLSDAAR